MAKSATTKVAQSGADCVYTIGELTENARKVFGTSPDIVKAALRMEGITKITLGEAKKIVEKFRKREV